MVDAVFRLGLALLNTGGLMVIGLLVFITFMYCSRGVLVWNPTFKRTTGKTDPKSLFVATVNYDSEGNEEEFID